MIATGPHIPEGCGNLLAGIGRPMIFLTSQYAAEDYHTSPKVTFISE
jgi:hypothetical protein